MYISLFLFQINLKLILVSGKTKEFLFSPSESAGDIAQHVFDNWPEGEVNMGKSASCTTTDIHYIVFGVITFTMLYLNKCFATAMLFVEEV